MKLDTLLIIIFVVLIGSAFFIAQETKAERNFMDTVKIIMGLQAPHNNPPPEETLVAPFAEDSVKPISKEDVLNKRVNLPVNKIPMNLPHRSIENVTTWIVDTVTDSLTLNKKKVEGINKNIKPYFTDAGFKNYSDFGNVSNIFSLVYYDPNASLVSFIAQRPVNIHSQSFNGIYQWRFEINVMMNIVKNDPKTNKKAADQPEQRNVTFCIDVIRINDPQGEGLAINAWGTVSCPTEKDRAALPN